MKRWLFYKQISGRRQTTDNKQSEKPNWDFICYLTLKRSLSFYLNKLEFPLPKVWLKLVQWFRRRRYFNVVNECLLFLYFTLPLKKSVALHSIKLESHSSRNVLCHDWSQLNQWLWRRGYNQHLFTKYKEVIQHVQEALNDFLKNWIYLLDRLYFYDFV